MAMAMRAVAAAAVLLLAAAGVASAATLALYNWCGEMVWPGIQPSAGKELLAQDFYYVSLVDEYNVLLHVRGGLARRGPLRPPQLPCVISSSGSRWSGGLSTAAGSPTLVKSAAAQSSGVRASSGSSATSRPANRAPAAGRAPGGCESSSSRGLATA